MNDNNLLEAPKLPDGYRFEVKTASAQKGFWVILQKRKRVLGVLPLWECLHEEFCFGVGDYSANEVQDAMKHLSLFVDDDKECVAISKSIAGTYPPKRYIGKE